MPLRERVAPIGTHLAVNLTKFVNERQIVRLGHLVVSYCLPRFAAGEHDEKWACPYD